MPKLKHTKTLLLCSSLRRSADTLGPVAAAGGCEIRSVSGSGPRGRQAWTPAGWEGSTLSATPCVRSHQDAVVSVAHVHQQVVLFAKGTGVWPVTLREGHCPAAACSGPAVAHRDTHARCGSFWPGGTALTRSPSVCHEQRFKAGEDAIQPPAGHSSFGVTGSWARPSGKRSHSWLNCASISP